MNNIVFALTVSLQNNNCSPFFVLAAVMNSLRYKAFSLTWLASMQMYRSKRKRLHKKRVRPTGIVWNTNMAAVTSCENALYMQLLRWFPLLSEPREEILEQSWGHTFFLLRIFVFLLSNKLVNIILWHKNKGSSSIGSRILRFQFGYSSVILKLRLDYFEGAAAKGGIYYVTITTLIFSLLKWHVIFTYEDIRVSVKPGTGPEHLPTSLEHPQDTVEYPETLPNGPGPLLKHP